MLDGLAITFIIRIVNARLCLKNILNCVYNIEINVYDV